MMEIDIDSDRILDIHINSTSSCTIYVVWGWLDVILSILLSILSSFDVDGRVDDNQASDTLYDIHNGIY